MRFTNFILENSLVVLTWVWLWTGVSARKITVLIFKGTVNSMDHCKIIYTAMTCEIATYMCVATWSKRHIPSIQFCECLNEWVALLVQVNPSKHTKWYGIAYKGKVGDTFKCLWGCPADFTVKTCVSVPRVELQVQCSGFKYHEKIS